MIRLTQSLRSALRLVGKKKKKKKKERAKKERETILLCAFRDRSVRLSEEIRNRRGNRRDDARWMPLGESFRESDVVARGPT